MRGILQALLLIGIIGFTTAGLSWNRARRADPPQPSGGILVSHGTVHWLDSGRVLRARAYVPAGRGPFPTLLFTPGMTVAVDSYSTFLTDFASRGFLVIAIPHPRFRNLNETPLHEAQPVFAQATVTALDGLLAARHSGDSIAARIDTMRIAAVGHSIGGAGAGAACALNRRIRAAVDFDGSLYGRVVHEGVACPFLLVERAAGARIPFTEPPRFYEERAQGQLHQDSVFAHSRAMQWATIDGLEHMSFTDRSLRFQTDRWSREFARLQLPAARAQRMAVNLGVGFLAAQLDLDMTPIARPPGVRLKSKP